MGPVDPRAPTRPNLPEEHTLSDETVGVLLYSDDIDTRKAVMDGVGLRPGKDSPKVEWSQAATPAGALELMRTGHFAGPGPGR